MGLDMYLLAKEPDSGEKFTDANCQHIGYWRKHNALHGYMERLYRERGGEEDFNCVPLQLTADDLDALEKAVRERALTPTGGFFFGSTEYTQEDWEYYDADTFEAIEAGRRAIKDGKEVYYDSWW